VHEKPKKRGKLIEKIGKINSKEPEKKIGEKNSGRIKKHQKKESELI
jgi:hypothetical protein